MVRRPTPRGEKRITLTALSKSLALRAASCLSTESMCNAACLDFGRRYLLPNDIAGKKVLDVGSLDVNGSLRAILQPMAPSAYIGVDIVPGPGVDTICQASDLVARFGEVSFDVVVSTEMLEHVRDWRVIVSNLKRVLKPNGVLVITTRSSGFPYHGYPYDFWRYEPEDMRAIFRDMKIDALESDPTAPGVFLRARKPEFFTEGNLGDVALHSVIGAKRTLSISKINVLLFELSASLRFMASRILPRSVKSLILKASDLVMRTAKTLRKALSLIDLL
jgi:SAM-dependent methyltransferase